VFFTGSSNFNFLSPGLIIGVKGEMLELEDNVDLIIVTISCEKETKGEIVIVIQIGIF
jgi:hypothetical protein